MQNEWTVLIDDDCGTAKAYHLSAPHPDAAASFALRVYDAHNSVCGKVQYVFPGQPEFAAFYGAQPLEMVDLYLTDTDLPRKETA